MKKMVNLVKEYKLKIGYVALIFLFFFLFVSMFVFFEGCYPLNSHQSHKSKAFVPPNEKWLKWLEKNQGGKRIIKEESPKEKIINKN